MAHDTHTTERPVAPVQFWEARYAGTDKAWSGRPNQVLIDCVAPIKAGRALDLGCGEGGDSIWLANLGWRVTGIDISPTAIARAAAAAIDSGIQTGRTDFIAQDLTQWQSATTYDLISACFLQSPVALEREAILRRAVSVVSPGGHMLLVSHAAMPPWSSAQEHHNHDLPTPETELLSLGLVDGEWDILVAEVRDREVTDPDGNPAQLKDSVVLVRRR